MHLKGNWFVIVGYGMVAACTQLLWLTYAPITTKAADYYGASEEAIGTLSIIFPLIYVVLAIPCGLFLDRMLRPALALGAVLTTFGGIIRVFGEASYETAVVGQVIVSIGQPLVLGAITALCVHYLPKDERAKGIAFGSAALFMGMLVAFVTGALFESNIALLLQVQAGLSVIAAIVLGVGLTRPGDFAEQLDYSSYESSIEAQTHPLRTIWRDPVIRLLVLIVAVGFGVFVTITTWLQALLEPAGIGVDGASLMLLIMVVAGVIGSALFPPFAAQRRNQPTWLLVAIVVSAVGCLTLAVAPSEPSGIVVSVLLGLLLLATLPIVLELVEVRTGSAASTGASLVWLAGNAGGVVLSIIVGLFVGMPGFAFALTGLVALVCGVPLVLKLRNQLTQEQASAS